MKSSMNQLYELTNLALLTPQNLVENIQLDNYLEIRYYTKNKEIICEMLAEDEDGVVTYIYYFSMKNQLQRVYATYGDENMELFDRSKELKAALDEYDQRKKSHIA